MKNIVAEVSLTDNLAEMSIIIQLSASLILTHHGVGQPAAVGDFYPIKIYILS